LLLKLYICKGLNDLKMAIAIKSIPILKNKAAQAFIEKASSNSEKKSTIDFSLQSSIASKILEKAKF
jgi:hypothetical protein